MFHWTGFCWWYGHCASFTIYRHPSSSLRWTLWFPSIARTLFLPSVICRISQTLSLSHLLSYSLQFFGTLRLQTRQSLRSCFVISKPTQFPTRKDCGLPSQVLQEPWQFIGDQLNHFHLHQKCGRCLEVVHIPQDWFCPSTQLGLTFWKFLSLIFLHLK